MVQQNPFADFQEDPFFQFGTRFSRPMTSTGNLGISGDILEVEPDIPFQGALQAGNLSPNLFRMFQGQRSNLFNQFQGLLDQQMRQGMIPNLRFGDFMTDFDFEREAFRLPPDQRIGGGTSQFAPRTQFIR